jgi:hypothetical protein
MGDLCMQICLLIAGELPLPTGDAVIDNYVQQ